MTNLQPDRRRRKQWCRHRAKSSLHEEGKKPVSSCPPSSNPAAGCCGPSAPGSSPVCSGDGWGSTLPFDDNIPKKNKWTDNMTAFLWCFPLAADWRPVRTRKSCSPAEWCRTRSWSTLPESLTWGRWQTCSLLSAGRGCLGWWGHCQCQHTETVRGKKRKGMFSFEQQLPNFFFWIE